MSATPHHEPAAPGGADAPPCPHSFERVMWHLDEIIHKINDAHKGAGYSPDALWLEELRHHIRKLGKRAEDAEAEAARQVDAHRAIARGVKSALGYENWPDFEGSFQAAVARWVREALHAANATDRRREPAPPHQ